MKFASFKINGTISWGLIDGAEAIDLGALSRDRYPDLKSVIAAGALTEVAAAAAKAARHPLANIVWLPVIPNPDKILCIGLNYETHRKETGRTEVENPTVFGRSPTARPRILPTSFGRVCPRISISRANLPSSSASRAATFRAPRRGPHRGICLLPMKAASVISAPHPSVHARQEFSADWCVRSLDGDAG